MDQAYFTIRWKRLLVSLLVVVGLSATWFGVLHYQRSKLSDRLLKTADRLADGSDSAAARVAYLDYLELHPDDFEARVNLIRHVQATEVAGDERDTFVVSQATAAIRSGDSSLELRLMLIDAAIRLEWFTMVSQWLPSVSSLEQQNPRLIAYRGVCLLKKGDRNDAKALFQEVLLRDKSSVAAWSGLIELTQLRGDTESASAVAQDWVAETASPISYLTLARLLAKQGRSDDAAALYRTAKLPKVSDVKLVRELAQFFVHDLAADAEVEEGVLRRIYGIAAAGLKEPSYDDFVCLADLAHRMGDTKLAERHYQQCLESRPGDLFATGRQVELFSSLGLREQASRTLTEISDASSQNVLKTTLQARLLAQEAKFEEATVALESVVKLHSDSGVKQDCYALLVECLWEQQRFAEAAIRAEELLDLAPASDNARRFCAEAFIRSSQYSDAIKCIRGFTAFPEEQINAVWRLMAHADETGRQVQLSEAMDNAALISREGTVPMLFKAFQAVDAGQTSDSILMLNQTMLEYPQRPVFRIAIQASEDRAFERITLRNVVDVLQLNDVADRRIFLQKMLQTESAQVGTQMKQLLQRDPSDSTVVALLQNLLADCADRPAVQRQILQQVYPDLSTVVSAQGSDVVPAIAKILAASQFQKQAFELLATSPQLGDDLLLVEAFCGLMETASVDSPFHSSAIQTSLTDGSLQLSDDVKQILLAECDLHHDQTDSAAVRIQPLTAANRTGKASTSDAAAWMVMIHGDQLKSVSLPTVNPDDTLLEKYPNTASVFLASSRWNRSRGLHEVSAKQARKSFQMDQRASTLIEMAYSEWLGSSVNRASGLIALSLDLGLDIQGLSSLHVEMLQQMQADPRMEVRGLSFDDGTERIRLQ